MRVIIQRVKKAQCVVDNNVTGSIGKGLVVFAGFTHTDTIDDLTYIAKKTTALRIFENDQGKIHFSIKDLLLEILLIPQFTLYATTKKGNRPDFLYSMEPEKAKNMFNDFIEIIEKNYGITPQMGVFGANMEITAVNDGPFSIFIDSSEK